MKKVEEEKHDLFSDSDDDCIENDNVISDEINMRVEAQYDATLREFTDFLNKPEYINDINDPSTTIVDRRNITDGAYKTKCYNIPDNKIPRFFKYLEECRRRGLIMMMNEKQLEYSGIMIDFDIMQDNAESQVDQFVYNKICTLIGRQIQKYIDIEHPALKEHQSSDDKFLTVHFVFIKKPRVMFNEDKKYYKDGFHLLIPGIKIKREVKRFFLRRCMDDGIFDEIFRDVTPADGYSIADFVDMNSAHVPVHFIGSRTKVSSPAYELDDAYEIRLYLNAEPSNTIAVKCLDKFDVEKDPLVILTNELSLNWERDLSKNGIIQKVEYEARDIYLGDVEQFKSTKTVDLDDEEESEYNELSLLNIHDPDSEFVKSLLDTLHPKRYTDYELWFQVLCVLAHTSKSYKPLAEYFSKKSPDKFNQVDFEKYWSDALANKKNRLTIGSLHYWAKVDNSDKYEEIRHRNMYDVIYKKIYDPQIEGDLQHYDIAQILFKSLRHKYVFDPDEKGIWYEFIIDGEPCRKGEIYKWRVYNGRNINSMKRYISEILPVLFRKVLDRIQTAYNDSNNEMANYHFAIKKKFQVSCKKLRDSGFKTGVVHECEQTFERINFSKLMDSDPTVLGVGNGLVKLGKEIKFITGYHNYYVSTYTEVDYKEFNPYDPITKKLIFALRNLFPDNEPDSFNFMMHYLASSLDGRKKESLFLIFIGAGSNGKSFLMELHKSVIGNQYSGKVPLSFLTSFQKNSEAANPVLMSFVGKRFVYLSEANKCERANCARVKEMTGLETIAGRRLFGEMVNFKPTSNITLVTNHLLEFDSNDHGMWRRIKIVPAKMKFCKKNMDEYDENNPYEREADLSLGRDWSEDPDVQSAHLSLMTYFYSSLHTNYDGIVENVPHPHIKKETENYRNKQDHINNFISMRIVKSVDASDELTIDALIEKYSRWYESLNPDDKMFKKGLQQAFENSSLAGIMSNTRSGKIIKGYRILEGSDKPEAGERYFSDISKKTKKVNNIVEVESENAQELWERLCREYDQKKQNVQPIKKKSLANVPRLNEAVLEKSLRGAPAGLRMPTIQRESAPVSFDDAGFRKRKTASKAYMEFIDFSDASDDDDSFAVHEPSDTSDEDGSDD